MKKNIYLLLTLTLAVLSSCSKEESSPAKAVDFRPNIVGEFTTWSDTYYDKDFKVSSTASDFSMIEIKENPSNDHGINVFYDGTFEVALMNGIEVEGGYAFTVLAGGDVEGYKGITVGAESYEAVYYTGSNILRVYIANFENGTVADYTLTEISGKK